MLLDILPRSNENNAFVRAEPKIVVSNGIHGDLYQDVTFSHRISDNIDTRNKWIAYSIDLNTVTEIPYPTNTTAYRKYVATNVNISTNANPHLWDLSLTV